MNIVEIRLYVKYQYKNSYVDIVSMSQYSQGKNLPETMLRYTKEARSIGR